jgi:hypothetical protein
MAESAVSLSAGGQILSLDKIFISSTFLDLQRERDSAAISIRYLGLEAITMPQPASPKAPANASLELLAQCDAVVLLIGDRYGSPLADTKLSITEMEYDRATELELPVFAFVLQRPWWDFWRRFKITADEAESRNRFLKKIERNVTYRITKPSTLNAGITEALRSASRPSHFISPSRYFRNRVGKPSNPFLFALDDNPVGRDEDLKKLDEFSEGTKPFLFVKGPQGVGKSNLLWVHSERVRKKGWWVGFWTGVEATPKVMQELLSDSYTHGLAYIDYGPEIPLPLLRGFLAQFLRTKLSETKKVRFVISIPDRLESEMRAVLGDLYSEEQSSHLKIKPLADSLPLRTWIERNLSRPIGAAAIADLIKKTNGLPLLIKAGIRLLETGKISTTELSHDPDIQDLYLKNALHGTIQKSARSEKLKEWLWAAALLSPFSRNDEEVQKRGAAFLKVERWEWIDLLEEAEAAGLVERVGRFIRVSPEVLSDYLVDAACFGASGTIRSDYIAAALDSFLTLPFDNRANPLITNLAQSEYRHRKAAGEGAPTNPLWTVLSARFAQATLIEKCEWFKQFKSIAVYSPEWAWNLTQDLLGKIGQLTPEEVWPHSGLKTTADDLLEKIPPVLVGVALHGEYFDRAAGALWRLRIQDSRPTNQFPEHSARLLEDLATFKLGKPIFYSDRMLDQIKEWLGWKETQTSKVSPLHVGHPIFSKELEVTHWLAGSVSIGFRMLNPVGSILALRKKFRDLLEECALGKHGNWLINEAINLLCEDVAPPRGMMGMNVTKEMHGQWEAEQSASLEALRRVRAAGVGPIPSGWMWERLEWIAQNHPSSSIRKTTSDLRSELEKTPDFDLYKVLLVHASDLGNNEQAIVAKRLLAGEKNPKEVLALIAGLHAKLAEFNADARGFGLGGLVSEMSRLKPALGLAAGKELLASGPKDLLFLVMGFIASAREDPAQFGDYLHVVISAVKNNVDEVVWQLPNYYRAYASALRQEEWPIIECIVTHEKARTNTLTFYVLRELARHAEHRERVRKLLLGLPPTTDAKLADSICEIFDDKDGLKHTDLSKKETVALLTKFLKVPRFEYNMHWLGTWLAYIGRTYPDLLLRFFVFRIRMKGHLKDPLQRTNFRPVPHSLSSISAFFKATPEQERKRMMARLIAILGRPDDELRYDVRELFWHVGTWDQGATAAALEEALRNGKLRAEDAAWLLAEAPEAFVVSRDRLAFLEYLLRAAKAESDEIYDRARANLVYCATSGETVRTVGEPSAKFKGILEFSSAVISEWDSTSPVRQLFEDLKKAAEQHLEWEKTSDVESDL